MKTSYIRHTNNNYINFLKRNDKYAPNLLFGLRREHHRHTFSLQFGHHFHFRYLFEVGSETEQQYLPLLLEDYRTPLEKDVCLHFRPLADEVLRVAELEVIVVVVGLRTETYLLYRHLHGLRLQLLGLLLLLVEELLVIGDTHHGRLRLGRDFDKVELLFAGEPERLAGRHHCRTAFDAVAHHPHLRDGNPLVNPVGRLLLHPSGVRSALLAGSRRGRFGTVSFLYGVYSFVLLD